MPSVELPEVSSNKLNFWIEPYSESLSDPFSAMYEDDVRDRRDILSYVMWLLIKLAQIE